MPDCYDDTRCTCARVLVVYFRFAFSQLYEIEVRWEENGVVRKTSFFRGPYLWVADKDEEAIWRDGEGGGGSSTDFTSGSNANGRGF